MEKYKHKVHYYETDRMGFTHHSNYIRWMEEARIDFFDRLGWSYRKFEDEGIISPVTAIECKYKQTTEHCFLGKDGRFVQIRKEYPEFWQALNELAGAM